MSPSAVSLTTILAIVALGATIGFLAGVRRKMDLEQWTVGGRGFGAVLMYLLMAGEVYTTFSFLGASGWAYSRGGPTLYIMAYLTLAYVVSFFILPQIWEVGRKYGLQTQSDFFSMRYGNKYLAAFVCVVGIAFLIPYLQLQLTGLGIIVSVASFDGIGRTPAMVISVVLLAAFVFASGVRAVAWISVLKDALMIFAALTIGIGMPYIHYGGIGPMFAALAHARPAHLTMPGATANLGHPWYISTVLLTSLGFYMWPHTFGATFTAKERRHVAPQRRGDAALHHHACLHLLRRLHRGFGGAWPAQWRPVAFDDRPPELPRLVPGRDRRRWRPHCDGARCHFHPDRRHSIRQESLSADLRAGDDGRSGRKVARAMVVVLSLISLYLAIYSSTTLVSLLLLGYAGVTQFFPGVVLGLYWKRVTMPGVFAGMIAGVATVAFLILTHRDPFFGWSAGFVALCLNFLITAILSLLTPRR